MARTKRVCIKCVMPIFDVIPNRPILGQINSIELTLDQIRKCLVRKANVREILGEGQYKVLTLTNYDEFDDEPVLEEPVQEVVEPEIPEVEEEPEKTEEETVTTNTPSEEVKKEEVPEVKEEIQEASEEEITDAVAELIPFTEEEIPSVTIEEDADVEAEPLAEVEEETPELEEVPTVENTTAEYRPSNNNYNNKKKKRR